MNWNTTNDKMTKTFSFQDFKQAMLWMMKAADCMNTLDHHAKWTNTYNKVEVELTTHSAGNKVTEKDKQLAEMLDSIDLTD